MLHADNLCLAKLPAEQPPKKSSDLGYPCKPCGAAPVDGSWSFRHRVVSPWNSTLPIYPDASYAMPRVGMAWEVVGRLDTTRKPTTRCSRASTGLHLVHLGLASSGFLHKIKIAEWWCRCAGECRSFRWNVAEAWNIVDPLPWRRTGRSEHLTIAPSTISAIKTWSYRATYNSYYHEIFW